VETKRATGILRIKRKAVPLAEKAAEPVRPVKTRKPGSEPVRVMEAKAAVRPAAGPNGSTKVIRMGREAGIVDLAVVSDAAASRPFDLRIFV
jgi:hypothetical protein